MPPDSADKVVLFCPGVNACTVRPLSGTVTGRENDVPLPTADFAGRNPCAPA
ncbi:Uncharacterised protein [Mycobacteroides abscessus subsp. bolletii]|nr:Uncharacterised protein [Mycobacteroides abscessus subsp. bolletii]SKT81525.1 Uncharacterised protein [Mycobacteroides abscessus subsp. bolletii]